MNPIRTFTKSLFISFVVILLTFHPFLVPVLYAAGSWSGDSWEGESWEGDSWDGSDLSWEGESWSLDSWKGNGVEGVQPWSLDGWNESSFEGSTIDSIPAWASDGFIGNATTQYPGWSGAAFKGTDWNQAGFQGDSSSQGNGWLGSGTQGNGNSSLNSWDQSGYTGNGNSSLNSWDQSGYTGNGIAVLNPWEQNGYIGNGSVGSNPWNQAGFQGSLNGTTSPYSGLPWASTGHIGSGISGVSPISGKATTSTPFYETKEYEFSTFVVKDIIGSTATASSTALSYDRHNDVGIKTDFGFGPKMYSDIFVNGFKLAGVDNLAIDGYDTFSHVYDSVDGYKQFKDSRGVKDLSSDYSVNNKKPIINDKLPKPPMAVEKALSKLSVPGAILSSVSSGGKTISSIVEVSKNWDESSGSERVAGIAGAGENLGDFLLDSGAVVSAVPAFQVAGGIMMGVGGALWVVSRGTRAIAENWDKIKDTGKKMVDGAKNLAKKGWKAITGLFGK
ncbi:hypothetical protein [Ornithinibacillus scapharcae]|uniref:hypothetical protein n=1 Tax=Ornithinibacillus scapharcae TaxID=1147159 RepID=UPI000225B3FC|nr:hypothetical protein [Ornithinibacillus scapharcae]